MGFVGEVEIACIETTQFGCVVGGHTLAGNNAEVEFAMDYADRCVPFVDKEVWRVAVALDGLWRLSPVGAAEIPVGKPELLGFEALLLEVEHAVVVKESFEAVVLVVTSEPVDAVAAKAGAAGSYALFVYLFAIVGEVVGGGHVVFHAESTIVTADFFTPCCAKAGDSTAVGGYDKIAGTTHNLEVPACAPELAYHRLGTAFAEEEGRVDLGAVVVVGVNQPGEHFLTVVCLDPVLLDFAHANIGEDVVVEGGQLGTLFHVVVEVVGVYRCGVRDGDLCGVDFVAAELEAIDVVVAV